VADLPILFSAPMVRAIIREIEQPGTGKTQTRRVIEETSKPTAPGQILILTGPRFGGTAYRFDPRYRVGDRLYVREAWRVSRMHDKTAPRDLKPRTMTIFFEAGGSIANQDAPGDWKPAVWPEIGERPDWAGKFRQAMHMPRWASRITLEVTEVRVQRLQSISETDARAEGGYRSGVLWLFDGNHADGTARGAFASFWEELNGARGFGWDANPWVAAYTFRPILGNIDQIARVA